MLEWKLRLRCRYIFSCDSSSICPHVSWSVGLLVGQHGVLRSVKMSLLDILKPSNSEDTTFSNYDQLESLTEHQANVSLREMLREQKK